MSIVIDENEWAAQKIEVHDLGKKPYETLRRVARYYLDLGYSKKVTHKMLEEFLLRCDPRVRLQDWSNIIDYALKYASKHPAINIDGVGISQSELDTIASLNGKPMKRLAFTLLCLAKYWKAVNPETDYWIKNQDKEVMSLANIQTSVKRQCLMYHDLREAGLIRFAKKIDSESVQVLFATNDEPVLYITDFKDLGYQYLMYCGEPYFKCENCGAITKLKDPQNRRRQKYCQNCAVKIHIKQKADSAMRLRNAKYSKINK